MLGARKLDLDAAGGAIGEIGMAPGVVADEVTGGNDLADEGRLGLGAAADHEEDGVDIAAGQDFEKTRSPSGVGAVVEGKRQLAGTLRAGEHRSEDPRAGPHGRIRIAARGKAESGCRAKPNGESCSQWGKHPAYQCDAPGAGTASGRQIGVYRLVELEAVGVILVTSGWGREH